MSEVYATIRGSVERRRNRFGKIHEWPS
jgi:hypothetical protein